MGNPSLGNGPGQMDRNPIPETTASREAGRGVRTATVWKDVQ